MRSVLSRAGAVLLAVLALVLTTVGVTAAPAVSAQTPDQGPRFLELAIDEVTPSVVSLTSEPTVTVTGTVTNVGDRAVEDVWVRLQRAPVVSDSDTLRTALTLDQAGFDTVGEFEEVADRIERGSRARFTLELPLRSDLVPSLNIDTPGVYPLLVNVNGIPEYGGQARLDDARFLLPVLGVPATTDTDTTDTDTDTGGSVPRSGTTAGPTLPAVPAEVSRPVATTLLWPLADTPRIAAGVPGSATEPARLVDDGLAGSLAEGGRLDGLLRVAEDTAATTPRVAEAMCLAIDPDLLVTVDNMTRDYLVVDDPGDPTGAAHPGTGTDAAVAWLDRLRALAARMCTTAVPFAQVDLTALTDTGRDSLVTAALATPTPIVDSILGISSLTGVVWPDSGVLTEKAAATVAADGPVTALLADRAVAAADTDRAGVRVSGVDGLTAALYDGAAAAALAALGDRPQTPSFVPDAARVDLADDSATARRQAALGAVAWPALAGEGGSMLLAPPQLWSASAEDAAATVAMVDTLAREGLATLRPFAAVITEAAATGSDPDAQLLTYPARALEDGVPAAVVEIATDGTARLDALQEAFVEDPQAQLTPQRFTAPLREGMLRAMSLSGRRGPDPQAAAAIADQRAVQTSDAIDRIFASVTVLSPGGVYTLTSEQSPLVLVARNDLPVGITVRLLVDVPEAMDITDIGPTQLPPRGSRTLTVPARISDSRNLEVEFALATESGLSLGNPTRVTVRSNAYGQVLAIVTGCAGALLLFLAGRRLLHRFRGEPDPADEGYTSR